MVRHDKVIEELHFLSDRISTQVRTVAVSLIIVTWGLLLGTSGTVVGTTVIFRKKLLAAGTFALIALFCDFLQYLFGYFYANCLRKEMEEKELEQGLYDYTDWRYKLRGFFFWFKQVVLIVAVIWLLVIIIPYLTG